MKTNGENRQWSIYICFLLSVVLSVLSMETSAARSSKIGISAGLIAADLNKFGKGMDNYNAYRAGYEEGTDVDFTINKHFSIIPELFDSQQGGGLSEDGTEEEVDALFSTDYMKLPINLAYKFQIGDNSQLLVFASPYLNYGVADQLETNAKYPTEEKEINTQDVKCSSTDDELQALDYGFNLGACVQIGKIFFKFLYNLGIANLSYGDTAFKNKNIALSIGYFF